MTAMLTAEMSIAVFAEKWNDCRRMEKRQLPLPPAFSTHPRAKQLTLSAKVKSLFLASFLCLSCSWLALSIADNAHVPNSLRYVFSPGTMLATHLAMGPTHSWQEMFEQLSHWTTIAVMTNVVFYGMLIYGLAMIFFAAQRPK